MPRALVYIHINSYGNCKECHIAGVRPNLSVTVLKVLNGEVDDDNDGNNSRDNGKGGKRRSTSSYLYPTLNVIPYGYSLHLLVGKRHVATGNPFLLDHTIMSGVVLDLNREV